ncbi:alpha/beta hydrolase [Arthrobacter tecti]
MTDLSRRALLGGALLSAAALSGCGPTQPSAPAGASEEPMRYTYGSDPSQFADLYLPEGEPRGVVVIIHGGFWRSQYSLELGVPLAGDLTPRGFACWNLEYRRVGNGGGWPETFEDIAAGIDLLATAAKEYGFDTRTTTALGHSAGGHLAVWAAGRASLPSGAPGASAPAVPLTGVVSQSGVLNLQLAYEERLGSGAVQNLLGEPEGDKYRLADPMSAIPLAVPVVALHGKDDSTVPLSQSESYVEAAVSAGAEAELVLIPGDHFAIITPGTDAWESVVDAVEQLA